MEYLAGHNAGAGNPVKAMSARAEANGVQNRTLQKFRVWCRRNQLQPGRQRETMAAGEGGGCCRPGTA